MNQKKEYLMNSEFISYRKFMDDTIDSNGKILQVNSH
jgi:hypothetical protein